MDLAPQVGARERDRKSSAHGPSSPDQITTRLIEGIQAGRYVPGQRLIEADLTAEYGVSRGTVREALSRLAAEGLIHLVPHRGAYIRSLTRTDVNDILLVVERLASLAARLAAEAIGQGRNRADFTRAYEGVVAFRDPIVRRSTSSSEIRPPRTQALRATRPRPPPPNPVSQSTTMPRTPEVHLPEVPFTWPQIFGLY